MTEAQISNHHCTLLVPPLTSAPITVQDRSTNGTFINGIKIGNGNSKVIKSGDHLSFVSSKTRNTFFSYSFQDLRETEAPDEIYSYYDVHEELGRGTFSIVKYATKKSTGEAVAIKIINKKRFKDDKAFNQMMREVDILKDIQHPNIVCYKEFYSSKDHLYIVLELATGGELFNKIIDEGKLMEDEARNLFFQMLSAVNYLHENNITHRDLKPENILLEKNGNVKISDFGLARLTDQENVMKTLCGTPQYVAPEIVRMGIPGFPNKPEGYGPAVDMWSLGCSLYMLLTAKLPFQSTDCVLLYQMIEQGNYSFPDDLFHDISKEAKDLISCLLDSNPETRITAKDALNHPWILKAKSKKRPGPQVKEEETGKNVRRKFNPPSKKK
uniref:non-specific serine/threonine protein kinase n=1 Tax=Arcella intermedia TaxID=1963864 RepID=A0A6B2L6C9_9EUKA